MPRRAGTLIILALVPLLLGETPAESTAPVPTPTPSVTGVAAPDAGSPAETLPSAEPKEKVATADVPVAAVAAPDPASTAEPSKPVELSVDEFYDVAAMVFENVAPAEIKEHFEFPNRQHWDEFLQRLEKVLQGNDPAALAQFEPEARLALTGLREIPGSEEYVAWLEQRLDYIEAAKSMATPPAVRLPPPPQSMAQNIPHYELWVQRLRGRPVPPAADRYLGVLQLIFSRAGLPPELAWLAEVESSFNPTAESPVGARGLFQLMPETARELGLSTRLPDERADPEKSASAAARYLRELYRRFGDWPLALAAYNAGPGSVQRALQREKAKSFTQIASSLPVETRMYVPKVLAVLQVRAGVSLVASR